MSSKWKLPYQKTKKERQQPSNRAHLGFLEKKKDYKQRAEKQHIKERMIHDLKRQAALRNPDEFYFSMITDTKSKALETKTKPIGHFTKDQRNLLETRDQNYILMKLQSNKNQLEALKKQLPAKQKFTRYFSSIEEARAAALEEKNNPIEPDTPEVLEIKKQIQQKETLVRQLQEVYDEMQLQRDLKDGEYTAIEDDDGNVNYVWKKERKK